MFIYEMFPDLVQNLQVNHPMALNSLDEKDVDKS